MKCFRQSQVLYLFISYTLAKTFAYQESNVASHEAVAHAVFITETLSLAMQWDTVYGWQEFSPGEIKLDTALAAGQRLPYWATRAPCVGSLCEI